MGKFLWAYMYATAIILIHVESSLHRVGGGKYTWKPENNFSDWAIHERFYAGDWLYFGFNRTRHNVLEVNKTSYEQCIDTDFITNVTRGGRDVFQLLQNKTYYFICSRGYCNKGMKLAIEVLPQPPPPPLATPLSSTSATATTFKASLLLIAVLWTCFCF